MFTAALFIKRQKTGNKSNYPSVVEGITKLWSVHTMDYYRVAKPWITCVSMDDKSQKHAEQKSRSHKPVIMIPFT